MPTDDVQTFSAAGDVNEFLLTVANKNGEYQLCIQARDESGDFRVVPAPSRGQGQNLEIFVQRYHRFFTTRDVVPPPPNGPQYLPSQSNIKYFDVVCNQRADAAGLLKNWMVRPCTGAPSCRMNLKMPATASTFKVSSLGLAVFRSRSPLWNFGVEAYGHR